MSTTLIQSLLLASGGIFSIGSITIVILLLISDKGWRNGLAYMSGYVAAYMLIGLSAVLIGVNRASSNANDSETLVPSILLIALGLLLLWMTFRNWRKSPEPSQELPKIFALLDNTTPIKSFAFGVAVTIINFKNLAIFLSAISIVLLSDLQLLEKVAIILLNVLVFCASVIVPVLIYLSFPQRATARLNRIKQILESQNRPIEIWVPLIFGLIFLLRGISNLL